MEPLQEKGMPRRLLEFSIGVFGLWLFMFVFLPRMESHPSIQPMVQFIEERDIDATALVYSEIEEFAVGYTEMDNTMDYMPRAMTP